MAICAQCNQEGGEGRFCENCGKPLIRERLCPSCGSKIEGRAKFCPECASLLSEQDAGDSQRTPGGLHAGDIGILKGNIDASTHSSHAGAQVGNIIIGIPHAPESNTSQAVCPICGGYSEKNTSFRCLRCNRDWICARHRDADLNWCQDCAAAERARREVEALRAEKLQLVEENRRRLEEQNRRTEAEHRRAEPLNLTREAYPKRQSYMQSADMQERPVAEQKAAMVQLIGEGLIKTDLPEPKLTAIVEDVFRSYGAKNLQLDPNVRTIKGTTGFSWQSLGQIISATIQPLPDGFTIHIASRTKTPQLLDYGRGAADVRKITDLLLQRLNATLP
jgi:hypothetical protein